MGPNSKLIDCDRSKKTEELRIALREREVSDYGETTELSTHSSFLLTNLFMTEFGMDASL